MSSSMIASSHYFLHPMSHPGTISIMLAGLTNDLQEQPLMRSKLPVQAQLNLDSEVFLWYSMMCSEDKEELVTKRKV